MTMLSQSRACRRPRKAQPEHRHQHHALSPVRKPAFAVEGFNVRPICWAAEAANSSGVPQTKPCRQQAAALGRRFRASHLVPCLR